MISRLDVEILTSLAEDGNSTAIALLLDAVPFGSRIILLNAIRNMNAKRRAIDSMRAVLKLDVSGYDSVVHWKLTKTSATNSLAIYECSMNVRMIREERRK